MIGGKLFPFAALMVFLACLMSVNMQAQLKANEVTISDLSFQPNTLVVLAGTTVTWINDDTTNHTVTSDDGTFHSGYISSGSSFNYLFNSPGDYPYHCNARPFMHGTIRVIPESTQPDIVSATVEDTTPDTIPSVIPSAIPSAIPSTTSSTTSSMYQSSVSTATGLTQSAIPQYSEYYKMISRPASSARITAPQKYDIQSKMPINLYFSGQNQAMSYSEYKDSIAYKEGNALWIQGTESWAQHVEVPLGALLSLIAISPTGGNGYIYEESPDGKPINSYYYFNPCNQLSFYADTVGQHILYFSIDGQVSNSIIIDVVGYNTQSNQQPSYPQQNYQQQSYQQSSNNQPKYQQSSYNQLNYQQSSYNQQSYQQQAANQPSYEQSSYNPQTYKQPVIQQTNYQPSSAPQVNEPPIADNSWLETSPMKLDSYGRLTMDGITGTDYDLQASNINVLARGLLYNGVSYILVANPDNSPNVVVVNPQMSNWNMQNVQVKYGGLTVMKAENMLQITVPALQSGLIVIQPQVQKVQKKRYSFTVGPKPAYSFSAGPKPAYSFKAGPKPPYSVRIGY